MTMPLPSLEGATGVSPLSDLAARISPEQAKVLDHGLYAAVTSLPQLRVFMELHVYAVWDFMVLVKSLQRRLSGEALPWIPPRDPEAARLIHEVVLGEETDEVEPGRVLSHFELYLEAMDEVGADPEPVRGLIGALGAGRTVEEALTGPGVPSAAAAFVHHTLGLVKSARTHELAAVFLYGREDLIPAMFRRMIAELEAHGLEAPSFRLYLERHVEVDEGSHGPAARQLLSRLCGDQDGRWRQAAEAAGDALRARGRLWDAAELLMERPGARRGPRGTPPPP